jgi:hypothetical protein
MTAGHRWWTVGVVVVLLIASPVLLRAVPVGDEDLSARALLTRMQDSRDIAFSGYAESTGTMALPDDQALSSLSALLGGTNRLRVWWRDRHTWRVAALRTTGETDLVHAGTRMVRWVYESKKVSLVPDVPVRLPDFADVLPNELVRHAFTGVEASELSRLPARRVAGRDALGVRLTPPDEQAGIDRVDVYADRSSGVPLQVRIFARGSNRPALTSTYLDFSLGEPAAKVLSFRPPHDAHVRYDDVVDLAAAADRFAARIPPATLAGLPGRRPGGSAAGGSVGVYGRGPTVLLAVPLWSRSADRVRADLHGRPGVLVTHGRILLEAAPLRLMLTAPEPNGTSWLLAGTVTGQALNDAADQLSDHPPALAGLP